MNSIRKRPLQAAAVIAATGLLSAVNAKLPVPNDNCQNVDYDFTKGTTLPSDWSIIWGGENVAMTGTELGLKLTLRSDAVTLRNQKINMQYGSVSTIMRGSNVPGVVTDSMLISPNKDEIDVEFVGKDNNHVQSNFFYQGIPSYGEFGGIHPVNDISGTFHNYTVSWTPEAITWYIDGSLVRTWTSAGSYSSKYGVNMYPTETSEIHLGVWAHSGDWSGGPTNWSQYPNGAPVYFKSMSVRCYPHGVVNGSSISTTAAATKTSMAGSTATLPPVSSTSSVPAATSSLVTSTAVVVSSGTGYATPASSTKSAASASVTTGVASASVTSSVAPVTMSTVSKAASTVTSSVAATTVATPTRKVCYRTTKATTVAAATTDSSYATLAVDGNAAGLVGGSYVSQSNGASAKMASFYLGTSLIVAGISYLLV